MADQNVILRTLSATPDAMSLDEVCVETLGKAAPVGSPERKQTVKCLGHLIGRGFVRTVDADQQTFPRASGGYQATTAGRKFSSDGRSVSEHVLSYPEVARPKNGVKAKGDALRTAMWTALRIMKKATIHDLIRVSGDYGVVKVDALASAWLKGLIKAGIVVELNTRAPGFAPTSNGFKRYSLLRDLGPVAPSVKATFVLDNNTGDKIATTPAPKKKVA